LSQVQQSAPQRTTSPAHSEERRGRLSRRSLFTSAAAISAFWGAASTAKAGPPNDVPADVDPNSLISKLVRRITFGLNQTELALANSLGYSGYLEYQLNYTAIDDSAMDARLASLTTLTMTQVQLYAQSSTLVLNELTEATILRSVLSQRQLYQRMVEFWTDHFNVDINKEVDTFLKPVDDRDVIRVHALGNFGTLLTANAHSPAMLTYLDNQTSTAANPNENYAREVMELHTLGVDGGYTQTDVHEVCRCLSGWGYDGNAANPTHGNFLYSSGRHDNGSKTIFAGTPQQLIIPAGGGQNDGNQVLNALINHPSTAKFIAKKMARWLLREDPSQALIDAVAATYTSTGGDIKSMIRTILAPNNLAAAPAKYKRPYHLMVSALRALPSTITSTSGIRSQLDSCGHRPFFWPTPDGYPDTLLYWQGLILPRWNYGAALLNGNISNVSVDYTTFFNGLTTAQQMVDKIDLAMFGGQMPATDKDKIRLYLLPDPVTNVTKKRDAIGLAIGAPGFQWY
jgi:uncharacterized protein (DUF1800 family)